MVEHDGHLAALLRQLAPQPDAASLDDQQEAEQDGLSGEYADAAAEVQSKFNARVQQAAVLRQQLLDAFASARGMELEQQSHADTEFTSGWRQTGLPSKAVPAQQPSWPADQSPSPSPPLPPAQQQQQQPGTTRRLLHPGNILAAHQEHYAGEVLRPPVVFSYNDTRRDPHYLQNTQNLQVRHAMMAAARASSTSPTITTTSRGKLLQAKAPAASSAAGGASDAVASSSAAAAPPQDGASGGAAGSRQQGQPRAGPATMHAEQLEAEHKVIKHMHQRLTFKRNPRYPPPASMALLDGMALAASKPTWLGTSGRPRPSAAELAATRRAAAAAGVVVFKVDPEPCVFRSYEAGYEYQQVLRLLNTTNTMTSLRVLPPSSSYFSVSLPRVPGAGNDIAPGMAAEVTVTFTPDSRRAFSDLFTAITPMGSQDVQLTAQRPPPSLDLPGCFDAGHVAVGGEVTRELLVTNTGGPGCFMLLPAADAGRAAAAASALLADTSTGPMGKASGGLAAEAFAAQLQPGAQLAVGCFTVKPCRFDLDPWQRVKVQVSFRPTEACRVSEQLLLVADDCTHSGLELRGAGSNVDVQLVEVDGRPTTADMLQAPLWLGEVAPGERTCRTIALRNNSAVPFAFAFQQQLQQLQHQDLQQQQQQHQPQGLSPELGGDAIRCPFQLCPSSGVLQPGELLQVTATFMPSRLGPAATKATLMVDPFAAAGATPATTGGTDAALDAPRQGGTEQQKQQQQQQQQQQQGDACAPPEGTADAGLPLLSPAAAVQVLQLFLEGVGRPCELAAAPQALQVPDVLEVNQQASLPLVLLNPSAAPVSFSFKLEPQQGDGAAASVVMQPSSGTVMPNSQLEVQVLVTGVSPGRCTQQLACSISDGSPLLVPLSAMVTAPAALPAAPELDFGLLQLRCPSQQQLRIVNPSAFSEAAWELQLVGAGEPQGRGRRPACTLSSSSGVTPCASSSNVTVTCAADVDGTHELLLRCRSGGVDSFVLVRATVVVPDIQLSTNRLQLGTLYKGVPVQQTVTVRNACRLPVTYRWAWQQVPAGAAAADGAASTGGQQLLSSSSAAAPDGDAALTGAAPLALAASKPEGGQEQPAASEAAATRGAVQLQLSPMGGTLAPGECVQVTLDLLPVAEGPVRLLAACCVLGMPSTKGLLLQFVVEGLQLSWQVLPWQPTMPPPVGAAQLKLLHADASAAAAASKPDQEPPQQQISAADTTASSSARPAPSPPSAAVPPVTADFGLVPLRQDAACLLLIRNLTSAPAPVACWLDSSSGSSSSSSSSSSCPGDLEQQQQQQQQEQQQQRRPAQQQLSLKDPCKLSGPFRAAPGNTMMAERVRLAEASSQLAAAGAQQGWAVVVEPLQGVLPPWGSLAIKLLSRNDVPGDYLQDLCVKVGDLPVKTIPCRLRVAGSPLQLHRQRVLLPGMSCLAGGTAAAPPPCRGQAVASAAGRAADATGGGGRSSKAGGRASADGTCLAVDLGEVLALQELTNTFYVTNSGGMAMSLQWELCSNTVCSSDSPCTTTSDAPAAGATGDSAHTAVASQLEDGNAAVPAGAPASLGALTAGGADGGAPTGSSDGGGGGSAEQQPAAAPTAVSDPEASAPDAPPATDADAQPQRALLSGPSSLLQLLGRGTQPRGTDAPTCAAGASSRRWSCNSQGPAAASSEVEAAASGFAVTPRSCVIAPGEQAAFHVTFSSDRQGLHHLVLRGRQALVAATPLAPSDAAAPEDAAHDAASSVIKLQLWPTGSADQPLQALLRGGFHRGAAPPPSPLPPLQVDLRASLPAPALQWDPDTTSWSVDSIHDPLLHPSYRRTILLRNTRRCPLSFRVQTQAPFEVLAVQPSVQQDPDRFRGTKAWPERMGRPPALVYLPSGQSVKVAVRCNPPEHPALQQQQQLQLGASSDMGFGADNGHSSSRSSSSSRGGAGGTYSMDVPGELLVCFSSGPQQVIPLTVTQNFPQTTLSAPALAFGKVHASNPRTLQLTLTNPTTVEARWRVAVADAACSAAQQGPSSPQLASSSSSLAAASQPATTPAGGKRATTLPPLRAPLGGSAAGAAAPPGPAASADSARSLPGASPRSMTSTRRGAATAGTGATAVTAKAACPFTVSQLQGVLPGRGLKMPHQQVLEVTFSPSSGSQAAEAVLRVTVQGGFGGQVLLTGAGDLQEPLPGLPNVRGF